MNGISLLKHTVYSPPKTYFFVRLEHSGQLTDGLQFAADNVSEISQEVHGMDSQPPLINSFQSSR